MLKHGHREHVRLEPDEPPTRALILTCYLQPAPGARAHIPVDQHADLSEFEKVASEYPVFRIRSGSGM